ncbi:MAG: hypothetical protein ABR915_18740 [Thermoguttaceae bacterium]
MNRKRALAVSARGKHGAWLANAVGVSLALSGLWSPYSAKACQVPVFRYALERWEAAPYKAVVFHRGPLEGKDRGVLDSLGEAAEDPKQPVNLEVQSVDLAGDCPPPLAELHRKVSPPALPWIVLVQPDPEQPAARDEAGSGPAVAWSGPLDPSTVARVLDSPLRRELARRLLKGESAVLVLLESGDRARDAAAAETLSTNLKKLQITLADSVQGPADAQDADPDDSPRNRVSPGVPLHVAFSVLELSRRDAAEDVLVKMLLATGPEQKDSAAEPMAYVVFGRGRVLGPLVGKTIDPEGIASACEFLVGDCSCVIKDDRPGTDLLMSADWNGLLEGGMVDKTLPPLTGVMPAGPPAAEHAPAAMPAAPEPDEPADPGSGRLVRNVAIALAAVLVLTVIGTVLIRRRFGEQ